MGLVSIPAPKQYCSKETNLNNLTLISFTDKPLELIEKEKFFYYLLLDCVVPGIFSLFLIIFF